MSIARTRRSFTAYEIGKENDPFDDLQAYEDLDELLEDDDFG
eukprot:COSAG06_NODE_57608_length_279_cov_21.472222_1_plen_41_part_10